MGKRGLKVAVKRGERKLPAVLLFRLGFPPRLLFTKLICVHFCWFSLCIFFYISLADILRSQAEK